MASRTIFLTSFGVLYKLTNRSWNDFLRAVANGDEVSVEQYGKIIGNVTADISELTAAGAGDYLGGKPLIDVL
jgi:hypothetical protein